MTVMMVLGSSSAAGILPRSPSPVISEQGDNNDQWDLSNLPPDVNTFIDEVQQNFCEICLGRCTSRTRASRPNEMEAFISFPPTYEISECPNLCSHVVPGYILFELRSLIHQQTHFEPTTSPYQPAANPLSPEEWDGTYLAVRNNLGQFDCKRYGGPKKNPPILPPPGLGEGKTIDWDQASKDYLPSSPSEKKVKDEATEEGVDGDNNNEDHEQPESGSQSADPTEVKDCIRSTMDILHLPSSSFGLSVPILRPLCYASSPSHETVPAAAAVASEAMAVPLIAQLAGRLVGSEAAGTEGGF